MRDLFHLKENGTTPSREVIAGITTFFSMAYILIVAPSVLSGAGMEWGAVFLASIIASIVGTLVMALYANVPFALAPGLGMSSFLVVTVCGQMGFTWQQGLSMVFICGVINILITVTNLRRAIIASIPETLQCAISGGIGLFVAYVGVLAVGLVDFSSGTPALASLANPPILLFIAGVILTLVLYLRKVPGAVLLSIIAITLLGVPLGVTYIGGSVSFIEAASQLPTTFGAIFTSEGLPSLFTSSNIVPALVAIVSFSLVDTFDTIGTFVGAGKGSGIFTTEELTSASTGRRNTRLDRALIADSCATSVGAILGTSNTTTLVESSTGVAAGGRTGLTSLVTALCMVVAMFFAILISVIPASAYASALVLVGILMFSSLKEIDWTDLAEAVPAFFASAFMAICYNISYGIALGFIVFCLTRMATGRVREISTTMWVVSALFVVMFALQMLV